MSVSSDDVDDDLLLQSFNDDWSVLSRLRVSLSYSATIATRIHLSRVREGRGERGKREREKREGVRERED